jgi:hypothetical protein
MDEKFTLSSTSLSMGGENPAIGFSPWSRLTVMLWEEGAIAVHWKNFFFCEDTMM